MATAKKRVKKEQYNMNKIYHSFTRNLEGLRIFVDNVAPVAMKYDKTALSSIEKAVRKTVEILLPSEAELEDGKKKEPKIKLTGKQMGEIIELLQPLRRLTGPQVELLYRSSFVMLMSYFDFFVSDLIHCFYQFFPGSLSGKDLSMTLNELRLCGDLSEAVDHILNKEIDKVLYDTLENQKRYFEKYLKIDTKKNIIRWNIINEAMERRHIVVHNSSKINKRYLKNIDPSVVPEKKKDLKEGKEITIRPSYFANSIDEILIAGAILIQSCWRQWRQDDLNNADQNLIEEMFDALSKEKWAVAERLGLFSRECKVFNDRNRLYLDINYYQSLKWQNKKGELEKELGGFDVSGRRPIYELAFYALRSDRDNFYENVEKAIRVDNMKKEDFMKWPLFRELREDSGYEEAIERAFASISQEKQGHIAK